MRSERPIRDRDLVARPGGSWILAGQRAGDRLLSQLRAEGTRPGGAVDGWDEITRRGRIENLLLTEHAHDETEFLRRHFDREQLFVARRSVERGPPGGAIVWDLTPEWLGARRRLAIGVALSFQSYWRQRGRDVVLVLGASRLFRLDGPAEVDALLSLDPSPRPSAGNTPERRLAGVEAMVTSGASWSIVELVAAPGRHEDPEGERHRTGGRGGPGPHRALVEIGMREVRYLEPSRRGRGVWKLRASAAVRRGEETRR